MQPQNPFVVRTAIAEDYKYVNAIIEEMALSAQRRKVQVQNRTPPFIKGKINKGLSVIAIDPENGNWVGFCYLEVWGHQKYIANSGLIVSPKYRGQGVSKAIKYRIFRLCRTSFPQAQLLSFTANPAVICINKTLGYKSIPFEKLKADEWFWKGKKSWVDYSRLMCKTHTGQNYKAMVFNPETMGC